MHSHGFYKKALYHHESMQKLHLKMKKNEKNENHENHENQK